MTMGTIWIFDRYVSYKIGYKSQLLSFSVIYKMSSRYETNFLAKSLKVFSNFNLFFHLFIVYLIIIITVLFFPRHFVTYLLIHFLLSLLISYYQILFFNYHFITVLSIHLFI